MILYDRLDSGNSDRPGDPANWTVERFVDEVDHVRNALGLARLIVVGSSWGGSVAASYAIRLPSGLAGLVLASPFISTERWIADNTEYREQLPDETQKILDEHEAAGTTDSPEYQDAVTEFYTRHLNRVDPWPEELNRAFELANLDLYVTMWGNTEFNATGTLKDFDVSSDLGRIAVPTLVICGEYDEATPAACEDFAAQVPNAQVEIVDDASYTSHLEQREAFMGKLRAFLAGLERRQAAEPSRVGPGLVGRHDLAPVAERQSRRNATCARAFRHGRRDQQEPQDGEPAAGRERSR